MTQDNEFSTPFAKPNVKDNVLESTKDYFRKNQPVHPRKVISAVSDEESVSKNTVRKAVRKLRMENTVVPAEPFIGEMKIVSN